MLSLKDKPWFHSTDTDASGRIIVYVTYIDKDVLASVPNTLDGKQVLVHFAGAKLATREKFTNVITHGFTYPDNSPSLCDRDIDTPEEEDADLAHLISELDRLERLCGSNTLQDLFYETHDGDNAVTNQSKFFPEIRSALEKIYNQYGFDVIYNELDG